VKGIVGRELAVNGVQLLSLKLIGGRQDLDTGLLPEVVNRRGRIGGTHLKVMHLLRKRRERHCSLKRENGQEAHHKARTPANVFDVHVSPHVARMRRALWEGDG
jgi:hypothetical protein